MKSFESIILYTYEFCKLKFKILSFINKSMSFINGVILRDM